MIQRKNFNPYVSRPRESFNPNHFRPPFLKHLHNLVINGFYARDVDADDLEFLEYVRHRGSANGSLPSSESVLLEELEFWNLPYAVAPDIERRVGPKPRPVMTAEQRAMQQARVSLWHARRAIAKHERAIADLELKREQEEWQKKNEKRKLRELLSDAEWDAAAPRKASFGTTVGRHHVPQWKLDENQAVIDAETKARKKAAAVAKAKHETEQVREAAKKALEAVEKHNEEIAKARETIAGATKMQQELNAQPPLPPINEMKPKILRLMKGDLSHVWTIDKVIRLIGCDDREFVRQCIRELIMEGSVTQL